MKAGTVILHSRAADVIPFTDSEELIRESGLLASAIMEIGCDHRLADAEPLESMRKACACRTGGFRSLGEQGMDLKELEFIANRELAKHGLEGWTFALGTAKRCLGICKFRTKRIEIAEFYAQNSPSETVLDTLLHEIAHAIAGPKARHGPVWKEIAIRLGAVPQACDNTQTAVLKPGDWQATCPACKKTYHRYKRPKTVSGYRCKCAASSPLIFEFMGDPALRPVVPRAVQETANWEAKCAGCETVHLRSRRPKAGVWRCKCPHRGELIWRFRPREHSG